MMIEAFVQDYLCLCEEYGVGFLLPEDAELIKLNGDDLQNYFDEIERQFYQERDDDN